MKLVAGQTLLVRGATSSVGMAATTLAKDRGVRVIGTTRQESKRAALLANGCDDVILDDGKVGASVRDVVPAGVDALLELVGPATALDSFAALKMGARACLTGFLDAAWGEVPRMKSEATRLGITFAQFGSNVIDRASYGGTFQTIVDGVESGRYRVNVDRTFPLTEIADAHRYMEDNRATGKVVGVTGEY